MVLLGRPSGSWRRNRRQNHCERVASGPLLKGAYHNAKRVLISCTTVCGMAVGLSEQQRQQLVATFDERPALLVGFVDASGDPFATRGWGVTFDANASHGRVVVPTADLRHAGLDDTNLGDRRIALNYVDIGSLRCVQLKGSFLSIEASTQADVEVYTTFRNRFFSAANEVDLLSTELLERLEPDEVATCTFSVDVAFDQTPGPGAGRPYGEP